MVGIQFIKTPKMHSKELHLLFCYLKKNCLAEYITKLFPVSCKNTSSRVKYVTLNQELNYWVVLVLLVWEQHDIHYIFQAFPNDFVNLLISQRINPQASSSSYPWPLEPRPSVKSSCHYYGIFLFIYFLQWVQKKDVFCELAKTSCFIMTCQNFSCNFTYLFIFTV